MSDAHRRVGLVDVLAAGARCAVGVDAQIGGIHFHLDVLVHFGIDENARERRMAARIRIERRLAHQAMHAVLGAQVPVGVVASDLERGALDARHFSRRLLEHFHAVALAVAVPGVHALEHRRPVLSLGAARARLDVHEAVVRVELVGEHAAELEIADFLFQLGDVLGDSAEGRVVVLGSRHLEEPARIAQRRSDRGEPSDGPVQRLLFPAEVLRAFRVVPDLGVGQERFDFRQAFLLALEVKDTSAAPPTAYPGPRASTRSD